MTGNPLFNLLPGQLHGEIETTDVTVSGGPTRLPETPLQGRKYMYIRNDSDATIYLGGADVTTYDGVPMASGVVNNFPIGRADIYATNVTTSSGVRIMEIA